MARRNPAEGGPEAWVDLDRYPILDLGSARGQEIVASFRETLRKTAICEMHGFLTDEGVRLLAEEAQAVAPKAYLRDNKRTAYQWKKKEEFPTDHPRGWMHRDFKATGTLDLYPAGSATRRLYEWAPLTEFLRVVLEEKELYTCADPYLSVIVSVLRDGHIHGWHFDTNDFAISLSLQEANQGGEFVFAPYVRSEDEENYEAVRKIFAGEDAPLVKTLLKPGTLTLFRGRQSPHYVAEVKGPRDRLMAIFSYHHQPGLIWPELTIRYVKNLPAA